MSRARRGEDTDAGARAHFADPVYYTAAYADRTADIDYYVGLATEADCSVLEYGCGNGRIALPLARLGLPVTGVDHSPAMLADFRRRLRQEPADVRGRVTLRRGDMRAVQLGRRYGLVLCTFNTLLHLYTRRDMERFCAGVLQHLRPGGRFVFDVSLPDPVELGRDPLRPYHSPRFRHASTGQVVRYSECFEYEPLSQILEIRMRFEPKHRPEDHWSTPLTHRQFFPQELEALLHYNGLRIETVHADYGPGPPDRQTQMLAYQCAARRGFTRR